LAQRLTIGSKVTLPFCNYITLLTLREFRRGKTFNFRTTAWFFYVLLESYYGGAMTMFFANEIRIPFENIKDVIRAYPDWILTLQIG